MSDKNIELTVITPLLHSFTMKLQEMVTGAKWRAEYEEGDLRVEWDIDKPDFVIGIWRGEQLVDSRVGRCFNGDNCERVGKQCDKCLPIEVGP